MHGNARTTARVVLAGLLAFLLTFAVAGQAVLEAAPFTATASDFANVRSGPSTSSAVVNMLVPGDSFTVVDSVVGEEVDPGNAIWYQSSFGNYVYSGLVGGRGAGEVSSRGGGAGRWIEVDRGAMVAQAIEDGQVVYSAPITVGRPGWETPSGTFSVLRRVANETMSSETIGIPLGAPGSYHLTGVLFTQYFTDFGHALHYNYWSAPGAFGSSAESRGCVGLTLGDAEFFWNFADVGTPVIIY